MMNSKNYSVSELQILLGEVSKQIDSILLNPSYANNQLYYQNFTAISLRTLKYINHYLNRINYDQTLGNLIDNIIHSLNNTLQDYKGRNIFNQNRMVTPLAEDSEEEKEEDEIYHFMNTRNNNIPIQCLGTPQIQRQRSQLAEFVSSMEKKKPHNKESKKSAELVSQHTGKLKLFKTATFDQKLTTIQEEDSPNINNLSIFNNRRSEEAEVQTQLLGSEIQKIEKDEQEPKSHCQSIVGTDIGVQFQSIQPEEDKFLKLTKVQSSKSSKSQKANKKGVSFKKGKTSNNLGTQYYSRQGSRKGTLLKEQSQKKIEPQQVSIRSLKTQKSIFTLQSKQVDIEISLQKNQQSELSNILQQKEQKQLNKNGSQKLVSQNNIMQRVKRTLKHIKMKGEQNNFQKQGSKTNEQIRSQISIGKNHNESVTKKEENLVLFKEQNINKGDCIKVEDSPSVFYLDPCSEQTNIIQNGKSLINSKENIKKVMSNTASVLPTATMKFNNDDEQQNHQTSTAYNSVKYKRITSSNMKPEYLSSFENKAYQKRGDVRQHKNSRANYLFKSTQQQNRNSLTNFNSKNTQKQKKAIQNLIEDGLRSSNTSKNTPDLLSSKHSEKVEELKKSLTNHKLSQFHKKGSKTKLKFYASLDNFGDRLSLMQQSTKANKYFNSQSNDSLAHTEDKNKQNSLIDSVNTIKNVPIKSNTTHQCHNLPLQNRSLQDSSLNNKHSRLTKVSSKQNQKRKDKDQVFQVRTSMNKFHLKDKNNSIPKIVQEEEKDLKVQIKQNKLKRQAVLTAPTQIREGHLVSKELAVKGNRNSIHTALTQGQCTQLVQKLRRRGQRQTLMQYLDLIEATHLRFCGKNCPHLQHIYSQFKGGQIIQQNIFQQLLRLSRRQ